MYYKKYFEILDFPFWSGARDRIQDATDEQIEQVAERIEAVFGERIPEDVEINDLVWFECDDIFYPKDENEDEDEDEDEEDENE